MPSQTTSAQGQMMSSEDQFSLQQPYLSVAGCIEGKVSSHSETMPLHSRNLALGVEHAQAKTEHVILSETKALYSGDTGPSKSADLKLEKSEIKLEHEASPKALESRPHQLNSSSAFSGHSDKPIKAAQMHPGIQPVRDSQGYHTSTKISSTTYQGQSFPYPRNTFSGSTSTYPTANNNYRFQIRDKPNFQKSYGAPNELVRGPRANRLKPPSSSSVEKDNLNPSVQRDEYNKSDFQVKYENAKFFMIKSYSEDDIHKSIKYSVWASTANGNNKLDAAFREAEMEKIDKGIQCPIFLFFSVNASGQFVGLAEMTGPVDFKKTMDFWQQDKWNGFFPVKWHIIKDIPNRNFQHITLENNDNRAVTFSRDTQEIKLPQGLKMLQIFKAYQSGTSILDDFDFYEEKEKSPSAKRNEPALAHSNSDSLDECSLEYLESSFRNMKVQERPRSYLESQYQPRARSYFETQYQGRPRSYFESQYQAKPRSYFESQYQAKPRSYFETQYQGRPRSYFESQHSHNNFRSDSASQYSNSNRRPYVSSSSTMNRS